MISRRWLVQSGAIGVFGVAVVSIPLWFSVPVDSPRDAGSMSSQTLEMAQSKQGGPTHQTTVRVRTPQATEIGQSTEDGVDETTRTIRTNWTYYEVPQSYQGPMCPAWVELR